MSGPAQSPIVVHAPHAALLIDFDNVTMGIRSDLTKELKALLSSEIIRGKVTVQRAYADWRRYPQYVMPLTERSIDMIWATAVGSTKKNATDIRLAIDAIELVFTRPEIGTYIILSGDSDFSSLVLKLKEYGKYVVGIGIRESASDLLIQNCDEYYSYSELAGLNKEVEAPSVQRDPWDLVREAVALMVRNGDVMRSDRLKQVMQQIDPNFDERNAGFNRFSKFVTEAGTRGLLTLSKLENGQYEVGPVGGGSGRAAKAETAPARDDNGRRGRGRGRDRRESRPAAAAAAAPAVPAPKPPAPRPEPDRRGPGHLTLGAAFTLMSRALGEIPTPAPGDMVRARMAALHGREDPLLDPERFPRLLRQANDAEIAEVRKLGDDGYEVSLSRVERAKAASKRGGGGIASRAVAAPPVKAVEEGVAAPSPVPDQPRTATLRFRRGSRMPLRSQEISLLGVVAMESDPKPTANAATEPASAEKAADKAPADSATPAPKGTAAKKGRQTKKAANAATSKPASSRKASVKKSEAAPAKAAPAEQPAEAKAGAAAAKPKRTRTRSREKTT